MAEPSRGLFYLPIIYLWTGGVECDMLAALAPPVHLSGERLGWTMLICMVSDFRRGRLEVSWKSALQGHSLSFPTSLALNSKRRGAVAIITVATGDWPSYSCSVHHRRPKKHRRKWHTAQSDHRDQACPVYKDTLKQDLDLWTCTVVVTVLRVILLKTVIFNTLMTVCIMTRRSGAECDFEKQTPSNQKA